MVKGDIETTTINPMSLTNNTSGLGNGNNECYRQNGTSTATAVNGISTTTDVTNIADISAECPLCMEPLDIDDLDFLPCSCGYQVCRFCWHRLKNDDNGLCPACRQVNNYFIYS